MFNSAWEQGFLKSFLEFWNGKGYEKGQTQAFWLSLLREVFDVKEPEKVISFEDQVVLKNTNFIDAYIPSTRVLIEQKGSHIDLTKKIKQSDGSMLTPFQQARRYISGLSFSTYPRWIIVCNFSEFHVHDMERPDAPPEIISLASLPDEFYRLKFLVQDQREVIAQEKELSVAAGKIVGQLYDELLKGYKDPSSKESQHSLNVLCVRLVFCLYAEDAGIFGRRRMFHDYLAPYRNRPRDVRRAVLELFDVFDTPIEERDQYDDELTAFPYVNGSLFANAHELEIPTFTPEIVSLLLNEASEGFDWSKISPTIFGAVFESTLNPETRRKGGMHYTSIENIHKVIDPLFLNDLKDELAQIRAIKTLNTKMDRLQTFHEKLASLTFFDPACGSGNFLTETYLSLRRLENEVIRIQSKGQASFNIEGLSPTKISLSQFYGIEINDFACAVAKTALWIAESQMLNETEDILGRSIPFFPLKTLTNIVEANALDYDWSELISKEKLNYIMGNPPFVGARMMDQGSKQKKEIEAVFGSIQDVQDLDYVCGWFKKAAVYADGTPIEVAFVATNSICQGAQTPILWGEMYKLNMHINYAYQTFKWSSEASDKAAVHCVIVSFSNQQRKKKMIFKDGDVVEGVQVDSISPYLTDGPEVFVVAQKKPLCNVPEMNFGNQPRDGGNFVLSAEDYSQLIKNSPELKPYLRPYIGAEEFINGKERWCLWLKNAPLSVMTKNKFVAKSIAAVKEFRLNSKAKTTNGYAKVPHLFAQITQPDGAPFLIVPGVSSEKRAYVPIGFMEQSSISSNAVQIVPNASLYHFAILTSRVHMAWMRAVAGRLKSDYRYSKELVYNTFVWPEVTEKVREEIEKKAQKILDARAGEGNVTMADLYKDVSLVPKLRKAHDENDRAVLKAYGLKADASESEIVAHLMKLYVEKVAEVEKNEAIEAAVQKVIGKKAETVPDWMQELRQQCLDGTITPDELITQGKARLKDEKKKAKEAEKEAAKK